jgi:ATP-dependent Clp protease protease subunit
MKKVSQILKPKHNYSFCVSADKYHNIYYKGDIELYNIMNLTRTIQEQNNKYKNLSKNTFAKNPINLHITSYGGDCEAGLLAYDIIKQSKFPIYTFCEGYVCSSATFLFLAGKKRFIYPHSKILIHQLSSSCHGTHNNMSDQIYNNNLLMNDMKNLYLEETKIDKKKLEDLLRKDIYLTAEESLKYGFVDKVLN